KRPTPPPRHDLVKQRSWARTQEQLIQSFLFLCAFLSVFTTLGIIAVLLNESVFSLSKTDRAFFQSVSWTSFLTGTKWEWNEGTFSILPLVSGTFLVAGIAAIFGLPIGILTAIFLSEYASPRLRAFL